MADLVGKAIGSPPPGGIVPPAFFAFILAPLWGPFGPLSIAFSIYMSILRPDPDASSPLGSYGVGYHLVVDYGSCYSNK